MVLPTTPVTLTPEQVAELNKQLSTMRHDINNHLTLIVAVAEVVRQKPQFAEKYIGTLADQPQKISTSMQKFSTEFEHLFGIKR